MPDQAMNGGELCSYGLRYTINICKRCFSYLSNKVKIQRRIFFQSCKNNRNESSISFLFHLFEGCIIELLPRFSKLPLRSVQCFVCQSHHCRSAPPEPSNLDTPWIMRYNYTRNWRNPSFLRFGQWHDLLLFHLR